MGRTQISLYAMDLSTGRPIVRSRQDESMIPASNLKVITSAAAMGTLGHDFTFETKLSLLNPSANANAPQSDAILIVKGDGDPAFGDEVILREHGNQVGDMPILVPGIGAQGGDLAAVLQSGLDSQGRGLVINASRSILYAGEDADFATAARSAAMALRDEIRQLQIEFTPDRTVV